MLPDALDEIMMSRVNKIRSGVAGILDRTDPLKHILCICGLQKILATIEGSHAKYMLPLLVIIPTSAVWQVSSQRGGTSFVGRHGHI